VASLVIEQEGHRQVQHVEGFQRKKDTEEIGCAVKRVKRGERGGLERAKVRGAGQDAPAQWKLFKWLSRFSKNVRIGGTLGDCNEVGGSQAGESAASGDRRATNPICCSSKLLELNNLLYLSKRDKHSQARTILAHVKVCFSRA
jgi:hypothetical protein